MAKVNPPPALRLPNDILDNPELKKYFDQLNTILFQLWVRSGGGNDLIEDVDLNQAIDSEKVTTLSSIVDLLSQEVSSNIAVQDSRNNLLQSLISRLTDLVDMSALAPPLVIPQRLPYGSFFDTTTQTAAAINTAYAITFNTTDISYAVYRGSTTSRIYVTREGIYNFQFSAQIDNTSGGNHSVYVWYRVNGVDVANSAGQVRLKGTDGELVGAWNFVASLKPDDYFELMWSVSDTAAQLTAQTAAAPVPAIPSVILTVTSN